MRTINKSAGERTKAVILQTALELFRRRGFEVTTMRDIARSAKVATGAAYYYFPSKEAIVAAYYDRVQRRHAEQVRVELNGRAGLRERLGAVMHSKLEILKDDRMFLGALFRYTGDPDHPLSVFGKGAHAQRSQSVAIFQEAIAGTNVSEELRQLLPWALWLVHLGMILFFIYDETEGQQRTHKLADGILDLLTQLIELTSSALVRPFVQPFQTKILGMLREAGWTGGI
ncbi:MAG TPA: TetR/AcrR family transcriptional regulator [Candidatus Limnocylindria bacterium]|jgi:AcrR family transcriptional regulator|nr:TetR/AcrR family transcriptional regulator [Candidatus Limnocylindria bacterium]